jgi:hypothetical protein
VSINMLMYIVMMRPLPARKYWRVPTLRRFS